MGPHISLQKDGETIQPKISCPWLSPGNTIILFEILKLERGRFSAKAKRFKPIFLNTILKWHQVKAATVKML